MVNKYNGGLTREQFLFFEIRIVASLMLQGFNRNEILEKIKEENLFQFPTERMISSIAGVCFRRIDALESETLVYHLANAPAEVAKQINLYAMMKYKDEVDERVYQNIQISKDDWDSFENSWDFKRNPLVRGSH